MATTYPATKAALQAGRLPAQARPIEFIPIQKNNLTSLSRLAVRVYCLRLAALLAYFFELVLQRFSGRLKAFRRHLEYLLFSDSLENQAAVL